MFVFKGMLDVIFDRFNVVVNIVLKFSELCVWLILLVIDFIGGSWVDFC